MSRWSLIVVALGAMFATVAPARASAPPETQIDSGPGVVGLATQRFVYSATVAGSTFECSLDEQNFASCPAAGIQYAGLSGGEHRFRVRATGPGGEVDDS